MMPFWRYVTSQPNVLSSCIPARRHPAKASALMGWKAGERLASDLRAMSDGAEALERFSTRWAV